MALDRCGSSFFSICKNKSLNYFSARLIEQKFSLASLNSAALISTDTVTKQVNTTMGSAFIHPVQSVISTQEVSDFAL